MRSYAAAVLGALEHRDEDTSKVIAEARLRAAGTVGHAETTLERLLEHPLRGQPVAHARARETELVTYGRRLALAVTALDMLAVRRAAGHEVHVEAAAERVRRFQALLVRAGSLPGG